MFCLGGRNNRISRHLKRMETSDLPTSVVVVVVAAAAVAVVVVVLYLTI
jgi:hypothetical protein